MSRVEALAALSVVAFGVLFFWSILYLAQDAREYTDACNAKGGVVLNAGKPSERQCIKDMGTAIIIQQAK